MPPPSFSSQAAHQASISRSTATLLKDATTAAGAHLHKNEPLPDAVVRALFADVNLSVDTSDQDWPINADAQRSSVCEAVADRLQSDLVDAFREVTPDAHVYERMLGVLEAFALLLGPERLVAAWAHTVLLPALAFDVSPITPLALARVHRLCLYIMLSVPPDEYERAETVESELDTFAFCQDIFHMYSEGAIVANIAKRPALRALDTLLTMYSDARPTPFLHHVALCLAPARIYILHALVAFMQRQSIHIYRITSTQLIDKLFQTLMDVNDDAWLGLGAQSLVMIMPHIAYWLSQNKTGLLPALFRTYAHMLVCLRTLPSPNEQRTLPVRLLFSIVYGIFPCRYLWFLRDPVRCLAYLGDTGPWNKSHTPIVQKRSAKFLEYHLTHPHLAKYDVHTAESAVRTWQSCDAADLTALCMRLYVPPAELGKDDESEPPLPLAAAGRAPAGYEEAFLQNELRFELYLKEQLLMHIGHLHRERIASTASEAEQQELQHANRTLRSQIQTVQAQSERLRAEMQTANARHIQWERELNAKKNTYREERRQWMLRIQELERELDQAHSFTTSQADMIMDLGSRVFAAESDLKMSAPKMARLQKYDAAIHGLRGSLSEWEEKLTLMDVQRAEMDKLLWRFRAMELRIVNSERSAQQHSEASERLSYEKAQLERHVQALYSQVAEQRERLQMVEQMGLARPPPVQPSNDSAVQALKARNAELELELLECRAQLEKCALDRAQHEQRAFLTPTIPETTLFSPNTLRTPQDAALDDAVVPPLSLGQSAQ